MTVHAASTCVDAFLLREEIRAILADDRRADLVISGRLDPISQTLTVLRGSGETLSVPLAAFKPSGNGVVPDFTQFRITDYGHTIQFGAYEATVEALLYECDAAYRQRLRGARPAAEQTFGAALRRLRKQRGLRREDFPPLHAEMITRIEHGDLSHEMLPVSAWQILAQTLGVAPEDIETF